MRQTSGDHEAQAMQAISAGDLAEAQVHATLAQAAATEESTRLFIQHGKELIDEILTRLAMRS